MEQSFRRAATAAVLAMLSHVALAAERSATPVSFMVEAQPLQTALNEWAQQAGLQVVWQPDGTLRQLMTTRVAGTFDAESALKLLLQGSGLTYSFIDASTVAIRHKPAASSKQIAWSPAAAQVAFPQEEGQVEGQNQGMTGEIAATDSKTIDEILVTGSHIRGIENRTNPVITIDRAQIDRGGYSSTQDLFRSLPQNFASGDASEDGIYSGAPNRTMNTEYSSGINLRGLGAASTLILLNGHRLAPSAYGTVVDVSAIPLAAIDRVEIMTEGSSAVYGSDAVGGVVNIILKKDYEGADTSLRYGGVTNGSRREKLFAQTLGATWSDGNLVGTVQYQDQDALLASDRNFAAALPSPNDLLPDTRNYALTLNARQQLAGGLEIYGDALVSKREFSRGQSIAFPLPFGNYVSMAEGDNRSATVASGLRYALANHWAIELNGLYSRQSSKKVTNDGYQIGGITTTTLDNEYIEKSVEIIVNGRLGSTPAGAIGVAFGTSYRDETLDTGNVVSTGLSTPIVGGRNVKAAFGELYIPIVGATNRLSGIEALELSIAARLDDYPEFGSTTNPRLGVRWSPWESLSFKGSYGKSFRAPSTVQQFSAAPSRQQLYVYEFSNPAGPGLVPLLILNGSRPLTAERARTTDFGVEFTPVQIPGLTLALNYYDINYKNRITTPPFDDNALRRTDVYGAFITPIVNDAEAQSFVDATIATGAQYNDYSSAQTGIAGVRYLYDGRQQNAAVVRQSGIDFTSRLIQTFDSHTFIAQLNASYTDKIETAFAEESTSIDLVSTFGNPVKWRGRLETAWSTPGWSLSAALNVVGHYSNNVSAGATTSIGSWETLDLNATFNAENYFSSSALKGTSLSLIALNAFNRDPPFVSAPSLVSVNYDPANASPLGRFIALEIRKRW